SGCVLGCWALAAPAQQPDRPPEKLPPPPEKEPPPAPPPPPCGPVIEKTISIPQVILVPEGNATAADRLRVREVEIGRDRVPFVLDFREEKQIITEMQLQPREEVQTICVSKLVTETVLSDCGKPCTVTHEVPETRTVKVVKYDLVPVQRQVIVRVPVL